MQNSQDSDSGIRIRIRSFVLQSKIVLRFIFYIQTAPGCFWSLDSEFWIRTFASKSKECHFYHSFATIHNL